MPGPGGKGSRVVGKAQAWVRRLDNSFFAGADRRPAAPDDRPRARAATASSTFTNLQLYSPKLRLSGQGIRRSDGTFLIEARGRQAQYGPLRLRLDGRIERPKVELFLDGPNEALGIRDMRLFLDPDCAGLRLSRQRPVAARAVHLQRADPAAARAGGRRSPSPRSTSPGRRRAGALRSDPGGFTGAAAACRRRARRDARLRAGRRRPADRGASCREQSSASRGRRVRVRSGRVDGTIILAEGRTTLDGVVTARGLTTSGISLARLTANAKLVNGSGQVRAALAGHARHGVRAGRRWPMSRPDRISVTGRGQLDRRPLTLDSPAVLTRVAGGWQIAPTRVRFGGGRGTLSGPHRRPARVPRRHRGDAAAIARHRLAQGRAGRDCQRAGRLSLGRPAVGQRRPARPRPEPRRAGAGVEADRRRASTRC